MIPPKLSVEAKDLMMKLLEKDVSYRLGKNYGIYEILKHPWLKEMGLYRILSK